MASKALGFGVLALASVWAGTAWGQNAGGGASGSVSASGEGVSASATSDRVEDNYIDLGVFFGVMFPSDRHNFENPDDSTGKTVHQAFKKVAPEIGARLGYYPVRYFGLEIEGGYLPTKTRDDDMSASLRALRLQGVGQAPLGAVTPFALLGFGRLGAKSDQMGDDSDPAFHFGAGIKVPIAGGLGIRLDLRDTMTQKDDAGDGDQTHHPEVLLGLSYSIGLSKKEPPPPPPPKDTDGDGFLDPQDQCPLVPGLAPNGCPPPDTDKDGFVDPQDKCPNEPGIAPDGCPDKDPDKDGILDPNDKCPNEAGVAPDGCPEADPDKDGFAGDADKCPKEPETKNGFQDDDGCPDEVPAEVKKFTGVIEGIEFDTNKATIRKKSETTLDAAVKVLTDNPSIKIEISGHTDNEGKRDKNVKLSQDRADAVKAYMVSKGIDGSRIQTRGAGPDEPIGDNKTKEGRQKNRRTEFKLLTQ